MCYQRMLKDILTSRHRVYIKLRQVTFKSQSKSIVVTHTSGSRLFKRTRRDFADERMRA